MPENPPEMVTIEECARLLGLHTRQVRRYAERLTPPDRSEDGFKPLRVRVDAIQRLRHAPQERKKTTSAAKTPSKPDNLPVQVTSTEAQLFQKLLEEKETLIAELRERIHDLQSANTDLRSANTDQRQHIEDLKRLLPPPPETENPPSARPTFLQRLFKRKKHP